ncbi:septum formation family protein [Streptomyces sp. NPDC059499]|uniref:septum formation family protein n=1 Tax=Streptomyces sp. NPDC059499 TaxID=3346852 RepID=UPI0036BB9340
METARRWGAVLALTSALVGTAACGADNEAEAGESVYGLPLAEQFHAATEATRKAGTAAFVSTLTYGTTTGDAEQVTEGSLDYTEGTSLATVSLTVDRRFHRTAAQFVGEPGTTVEQTLATDGDDVYVRRGASAWLRYTPEAITGLGESTRAVAAHAAGDVAPYSGTLADLVPRTIPRQEPERQKDGSRVYRVTVLAEIASEILPPELRTAGGDPVELTVRLDSEGRLTEVTADFGPVLVGLHEENAPTGSIRTLRATYELGAFGDPVRHRKPGRGVEDALKTLAPVGGLKAGQCAATDTGLGSNGVVRPVDCAESHDMRVLAQTEVDRTFPGDRAEKNGNEYADEQCRRAYDKAPAAWLRGAVRKDGFSYTGSSDTTVSVGAGKTETSVTGAYTCYVVTS